MQRDSDSRGRGDFRRDAANDLGGPEARIVAAGIMLARLLGRRIARERLEATRAVTDNAPANRSVGIWETGFRDRCDASGRRDRQTRCAGATPSRLAVSEAHRAGNSLAPTGPSEPLSMRSHRPQMDGSLAVVQRRSPQDTTHRAASVGNIQERLVANPERYTSLGVVPASPRRMLAAGRPASRKAPCPTVSPNGSPSVVVPRPCAAVLACVPASGPLQASEPVSPAPWSQSNPARCAQPGALPEYGPQAPHAAVPVANRPQPPLRSALPARAATHNVAATCRRPGAAGSDSAW